MLNCRAKEARRKLPEHEKILFDTGVKNFSINKNTGTVMCGLCSLLYTKSFPGTALNPLGSKKEADTIKARIKIAKHCVSANRRILSFTGGRYGGL